MAIPTCPKCGGQSFELGQIVTVQVAVDTMQCANCGAVVGILEDATLADTLAEYGIVLHEHKEALQKIAARLGVNIKFTT